MKHLVYYFPDITKLLFMQVLEVSCKPQQWTVV